MHKLFLISAILFLTSCLDKEINTAYLSKFSEAKRNYPFERWKENYQNGLMQYTVTNCNRAQKIFDDLITDLVEIGEHASEKQKVEAFKKAILATNKLNEETENALIETGEREELCALTDLITVACGLDPKKYGNGEGLASEWRDW